MARLIGNWCNIDLSTTKQNPSLRFKILEFYHHNKKKKSFNPLFTLYHSIGGKLLNIYMVRTCISIYNFLIFCLSHKYERLA